MTPLYDDWNWLDPYNPPAADENTPLAATPEPEDDDPELIALWGI